jgi:hypothetical protein
LDPLRANSLPPPLLSLLLVSEIFASCPFFLARLSLVARADNDGGGVAVGGGPRGTSQRPALRHPVSKVRPAVQPGVEQVERCIMW